MVYSHLTTLKGKQFFFNNYTCLLVGFLLYAALVITAVFILIFHFIPQYGQTHIMVYIGVCSLVGSLSVCFAIYFC